MTVDFRRDILEELTDCPDKTKVLSSTRRVVKAMDAIVRAPTPIRSADAGLCWPRGPRSMAIVAIEVRSRYQRVVSKEAERGWAVSLWLLRLKSLVLWVRRKGIPAALV